MSAGEILQHFLLQKRTMQERTIVSKRLNELHVIAKRKLQQFIDI
jgi:hypothetical protein